MTGKQFFISEIKSVKSPCNQSCNSNDFGFKTYLRITLDVSRSLPDKTVAFFNGSFFQNFVNKVFRQNIRFLSHKLPYILAMALSLASCKSGPRVTACVVDVKSEGFQCVSYPNTRYFLPLKDGEDLECVSPSDLEDALKACKNHKVLPVTLCELRFAESKWQCATPSGSSYLLPLEKADNFFCMSEQDRKRVLQRCETPAHEDQ